MYALKTPSSHYRSGKGGRVKNLDLRREAPVRTESLGYAPMAAFVHSGQNPSPTT
jgi:hypothetical protein